MILIFLWALIMANESKHFGIIVNLIYILRCFDKQNDFSGVALVAPFTKVIRTIVTIFLNKTRFPKDITQTLATISQKSTGSASF